MGLFTGELSIPMKGILWPFLLTAFTITAVFVIFNDLEVQFQGVLLGFQERSSEYVLYSILILSSDIILPVPSSIVMYLNGSVLGIYLGFVTSYIAVTISAVVGYFLGSFVSYGISKHSNAKAKRFVERFGFFAIIISRGIPVLSESVCIVCGYNQYNFKLYLILNLLGYIPICLIYAYFGNIGADEGHFLLSFASAIVISAMLWFFGKNFVRAS